MSLNLHGCSNNSKTDGRVSGGCSSEEIRNRVKRVENTEIEQKENDITIEENPGDPRRSV